MRKQKEKASADPTQATFWEIRSRLQPYRLLLYDPSRLRLAPVHVSRLTIVATFAGRWRG